MRFDPAQFWSYVITAFLGACVLRLIEFLGGKAMRVKEIERAHKIESARPKIRLESETQEAAFERDAGRIRIAQDEHDKGVQLADRTYEIDMGQLRGFWVWVGRLLGRIV
jgi:hypothetical protein